MSESQYGYSIEKLYEALICLATGKGDARERVADARQLMLGLQEKSFRPEDQEEWKWIKDQTTKLDPIHDDKETGVEIAKRIVRLYWKISANEPYE